MNPLSLKSYHVADYISFICVISALKSISYFVFSSIYKFWLSTVDRFPLLNFFYQNVPLKKSVSVFFFMIEKL